MTAEPVGDAQVLAPPPPAAIRAELEQKLMANILGPEGGETEELVTDTPVREYYLVGMLAPRRSQPDAGSYDGQQDELAVEGSAESEETSPDVGTLPGPSLFPSSIGLTFGVAGTSTEIEVDARWGRYERVTLETEGGNGPRRAWRRHPAGGSCRLLLSEGTFGPLVPDPTQEGVIIRGEIRRIGDHWVVTAFLVNDQEEQPSRKDEAWLFQTALATRDPNGGAVLRRPQVLGQCVDNSQESRALDMAYRDTVEFAVGHGTGVHADVDPSDPRRALTVTTTAVPVAEVRRTEPPTVADFPALAEVELDMAALARASDVEVARLVRPLVAAYRTWIAHQRARTGDPTSRLDGFESAAAEALTQCERVAERIEAGVDLLDPVSPTYHREAADAFRFANEVMWLQRVHTLAAARRRAEPTVSLDDAVAEMDRPERHRWYPFQLGFLLLNLPSLADPRHAERGPGSEGLVDLLFFPTGGGKTEAYLGLTAFTLAMRRLQGTTSGYDGGDGVGVLMRYTLRLLTVQQFQRAATLLCACEQVRRQRATAGDSSLGEVPFRLGLWVGANVTPTTGGQASKAIEEARGNAYYGGGSSPVQLTSCPWCGAPVSASKDAEYDPVHKRTLLYCGDPLGRCRFTRRQAPGEGLPVVTVDDEIYRLVPSMVIATADKFAQLPWQGPTRALFGRVGRRCERHGWRHPDLDEVLDERDSHQRRGNHPAAHTVEGGPLRPPDLIIQDELHLISGPLGSLMGLYETAVDHLCSWQVEGRTVRPKVVASTATVRRAETQAHQVFWRRLEVFPAPGLDAGDSFFAVQRDPSVTPGQRYLGVCAPGRRIKAVEIRIYVALLGAAQALFDRYGGAVDPWMTLVGYFSALRELAGMSRLVDDDVSTRLSQPSTAGRGMGRRFLREKRELTSRMTSSEIPGVLEQLGLTFRPEAKPERTQPRGGKQAKQIDRRPVDVLLATNMISVGVDVPRLGLMVVGGQPKVTAEYVQATGRIGRGRGPGLIVTVLNWARPRDLSHYETFEYFHATFARHVEALSVTPFAPRALDRGLTATALAMVRHHDEHTNPNPAPQTLDPAAVADEALAALRDRAEGVTSVPAIGEELARSLRHRLDSWVALQRRQAVVLGYRDRKDGKTVGLLQQPGDARWSLWTCPTSLREVEAGINLLLSDDAQQAVGPDYDFPVPAGPDQTEQGSTAAGSADDAPVTP
ncbi:MAG: DISARM system helicase DrmA [Actinomycetota bacterium]|nr:DISARM system helicase DrmA [Actinomycetota bacterium]